MATKLTNYQCPACTGPLHFDPAAGKLVCDYCGSAYETEEIEALYEEKNQAAAQAAEPKKPRKPAEDSWDVSGAGGDWGDEAEHLRAYNCPSCGAELICDDTTAASSCPYCGNPTVVPSQLSGALRPDYVIPFRLDKDAAVEALKKHYRHKPFLPRKFREKNNIEKLQGVYVPFWLFDADADGDITFAGTRSHTRREGEYNVTTTEHFDIQRSGSASFRRIPADGSTKMPDDYMDSIEPFDYQELEPFSMAYLPGYLADRYDVSAKRCARRADTRCRASLEELLRRDVVGYDSVTIRKRDIRLHRGSVKYALLPVWVLNTRWKDNNYLFTMNGQTGKLVGDLPVSKGKYWAAFLAFLVLFLLVLNLTGAAKAVAQVIGWFVEAMME